MATGWFQRATEAFGRPAPIPQPFDVDCDCTARLTGFREESSQKPRCPQCGQRVFILPATTYPIPASLQREWKGESDPVVEAAPPKVNSKKSRKNRKPSADSGSDPARSQPRPSLADTASQSAARWRQSLTPVRLVAIAIACGILLTAGVVVRKARRDHALASLQPALDRGKAALESRDYDQATIEFQAAIAALDFLGRDDTTASEIRRKHRLVQVAAGLSTPPLVEILESWLPRAKEADRLIPISAEGWLLFDVVVVPLANDVSAPSAGWLLDLPLVVDDVPVELVLTGEKWQGWVSELPSDRPRRIILAAQLDSGELLDKGARARIFLKPETAEPWSDPQLYEDLGLLSDAEDERAATLDVIAAQRAYLEAQP